MAAAVVNSFTSFDHFKASSKSAFSQTGTRKLDPIAERSALGEKTSAEFFETITPLTPAASAVRIIAPRFWGLLISFRKTTIGTAAWPRFDPGVAAACGRF